MCGSLSRVSSGPRPKVSSRISMTSCCRSLKLSRASSCSQSLTMTCLTSSLTSSSAVADGGEIQRLDEFSVNAGLQGVEFIGAVLGQLGRRLRRHGRRSDGRRGSLGGTLDCGSRRRGRGEVSPGFLAGCCGIFRVGILARPNIAVLHLRRHTWGLGSVPVGSNSRTTARRAQDRKLAGRGAAPQRRRHYIIGWIAQWFWQ